MTTAFVLSGGGSLGAVQVGMLGALAERQFRPDMLIGTSVGAVNAAYVGAHGFDGDSVDRLAGLWRRIRRSDVFPVDPIRQALAFTGRRRSLCSPRPLQRLIETNLPLGELQDAPVALHVVTTNVMSGEEELLSTGDPVSAVLASAAIPAVFPPIEREDKVLMDGGVANNTAVSQAIALGAERIIVLPSGFACALTAPPVTPLAAAMHALTLLIEQRLIVEIAQFTDQADIIVLPPLCPVSVTATSQTHVIVGASLAGAKAAEALRAEGFKGRVVLVGAEPERPYERPPLSKQLLRGETTDEEAFVHDDGFYADNGIDLRLGARATQIDVSSSEVLLEDGERLAYDGLLLTTGAQPRSLRVPGSDLDRIHYLRNLCDSKALRKALPSVSRVAVVGAGWIGSEVAASLRQLGVDVALVDPGPVPLANVLGSEVGAVYGDLHTAHGVELHMNQTVRGLTGAGHVRGVMTGDGTEIPADLVVVGIGVEPRTELAEQAGLDLDGGIAVSERLETSAPGVYAAGDVASAWHPRLKQRVRVEHWANAQHQGIAAAKNMLGADTPYDRLPYFFSDQYDLGMEYSGHAPVWDRVVFRGDPRTKEFIAFWIADDRIAAAMNVNVWDVTETLRSLIEAQDVVDDRLLADPDVPLESVQAALR